MKLGGMMGMDRNQCRSRRTGDDSVTLLVFRAPRTQNKILRTLASLLSVVLIGGNGGL